MKKTTIILILSLLTLGLAVVYMEHLGHKMAEEESQRVAIWAEATERFIQAGEEEDVDFYSTIMERNTSIPVYMIDSMGNILLSRNVTKPAKDIKQLHGPIEVRISDDNIQYIYYDDSFLLTELRFLPWVVIAIIFVVLIVTSLFIYSQQKSEQNRVWAGLSKETAHQLGTPISSLNGWIELLQSNYPNDTMIPEIKKDIVRLHTIADRFSKVGSEPELKDENLNEVIRTTTTYMATRFGKRVNINHPIPSSQDAYHCQLCSPLFSWVLENLLRNAVDASATQIQVLLTDEGERFQIDITDNGRGIPGKIQSQIFSPGFTTKQRGWGLGLSLAKRIIEQYHHGELMLLTSTSENPAQPDSKHGTTFRILLRKSK